ncbi:MAG: nitroreductase family protein [Pseudomonadota bacterium]
MQPAKAIFALDYIKETILAYQIASKNTIHDQQELKWANDVLNCYFLTVDHSLLDPEIKTLFDSIKTKPFPHTNNQLNIPYTFSSKKRAQISTNDFLDLCTQRRSVRWFNSQTVARSLLEKAIKIASLAPSACNRQCYQFLVFNDKTLSQKIISIPSGTKGFAHNIPCTIVVTADLSCYPAEKDRHLIYIDSSLASMQLMLALETLGLSSCPINWPDIEHKERELITMLKLSDSIRPIMLIAVGYAETEGKIPFSHKKSPKQLINYFDL